MNLYCCLKACYFHVGLRVPVFQQIDIVTVRMQMLAIFVLFRKETTFFFRAPAARYVAFPDGKTGVYDKGGLSRMLSQSS